MPAVSVIIVNYNSGKYLSDFIPSLKGQTFRDFEVVIVDNASTDDSLATLKGHFPQARFILNQDNLGYCRAVNQAIRNSNGKYVLTLNFDLILEPDFIKQMVLALESDLRIGSVSGKLYRSQNGEKTQVIDTAGHKMTRARIVKNRGDGIIDRGLFRQREYIFGVSGAAALYRRDMLEDIKYKEEYLDEDLIAGLDDVDVDWRAQLYGWRCLFTPEAVAYHVRGAAQKKSSRRWRFLNYRNRYLTIIKNDDPLNFLLDLPFILVAEIGLLFSMLIDLQAPGVIYSVLSLLPKFLDKRGEIQGKAKATLSSIRQWFK
jgi:GT2 family glycosyltransferase